MQAFSKATMSHYTQECGDTHTELTSMFSNPLLVFFSPYFFLNTTFG